MKIYADGMEWAGWGLQNAEGQVLLSDVCDTEHEALELRAQQRIHQAHRGNLEAVALRITVELVKS